MKTLRSILWIACIALIAGAARADESETADSFADSVSVRSGRAFGFLHRAIDAGYESGGHMNSDSDLAAALADILESDQGIRIEHR